MSIQLSSGAEMSILVKRAQAQTKLPTTAATEIAALRVLERRVNKVMIAADANGRSKISHGSELLVVKFKTLGW